MPTPGCSFEWVHAPAPRDRHLSGGMDRLRQSYY
jgi:hypothetical protein